MTRDADFERFAADATTGMILALRKMAGATFTESDRRAMVDGLDVIRVACVQPVGTSASERVKGAVSSAEYERAKMMVVMGAMQLWASGKRDLRQARDEIDAALDMLGKGRVADASPRMAEAVCRVTEAMQELAWTWSDRAAYGEGVEDGLDERD